jgi:hypothetical protein
MLWSDALVLSVSLVSAVTCVRSLAISLELQHVPWLLLYAMLYCFTALLSAQ